MAKKTLVTSKKLPQAKKKKSIKAKTSYLAEMQMSQNSSLLPLPPAPPHEIGLVRLKCKKV